MKKPLMRIPYTELFPPPSIIPPTARSLPGAVAALQEFLHAPPPPPPPSSQLLNSGPGSSQQPLPRSTVVLTGAGLSVASGLPDYRGLNGTYRVNKTYRPIYYPEFITNHPARQRYWARSFLGWSTLQNAQPNAAHYALRDLAAMGFLSGVITQNVDSFHPRAHPGLPTLELHGYLRAAVCVTCGGEVEREGFQRELARLNPRWEGFLRGVLVEAPGALETEDPRERERRGVRMNPDGDVEVPGAPYTTFRYPACPTCFARSSGKGTPLVLADGVTPGKVEVDDDGAWHPAGNAGILKPAVVMFGESIADRVKTAAEDAIDGAGKLLVLATSMATYSAWRLVKRAKDRGMPIGVVNIGGVRGEDVFFSGLDPGQAGGQGVRLEMSTDELLPALVREMQQSGQGWSPSDESSRGESVFKDMLS
ncbi:DHS-like NAD/FAD-binding domain-containing protein [Chaetomium sp. MPI-SDFR-AT-0129]|nr:DHS-like NAD/FAD-binding domain-containing protein [Chaetomium sp. MPI-SDFR-AT-0129]